MQGNPAGALHHALSPRISLIAALFVFLSYIYFFQIYGNFVSTNEFSRFLLTSAMVDDGTIRIDEAMRRLGETADKAAYNGHFYSDKAIGLSLMAVPPYIALKWVCAFFEIVPETPSILFYLRVVCVTVPFLLLVPLLVRFWREILPDSQAVAGVTFLFLFGTIAFTYAVQFVSNALAGMFLFASFDCLYRARRHEAAQDRRLFLAGALAGFSVLLEYTAAVAVVLLSVYAVRAAPFRKIVFRYGCGLAVCLAALMAYNTAIFGTPFDLTYHHMADQPHREELSRGFLGFSPSAAVLFRILFGSDRGLFYFCPVLLLSVPGFFYFMKRRELRAEAWLFLAIPACTAFGIAGMGNWHAGWSFGPRYLTPVVPFLMTAVLFALSEPDFAHGTFLHWLAAVLGGLSIIVVAAGTITFPFAFPEMRDPVFHLTIPLFLRGDFSKNLGESLGLPAHVSALFFCALVAAAGIFGVASPPDWRNRARSVARWLLVALISIGALAARYASIQETPFDTFLRGYACYYTGDYRNALSDLKEAWDGTQDRNLRNLIGFRAEQVRSKLSASR